MPRVPFNEKDKFLSNMPETMGFSVPDTGVKKVGIIDKKGSMRKIIKKHLGKINNLPPSPWN